VLSRRGPQTKQIVLTGDIFFDEPPPLDEGKGLFSGGSGLFDDDDEEGPSDWTPKDSKVESPKLPTTKSGGLFDSDDDIFGAKKTPVPKPPLFTEEPPVLEEKKVCFTILVASFAVNIFQKPIGGVSIFGGGNLFDKKLLKRRPSSDDEEQEEKNEPTKEEKPSKKVDLFGDDDLFKSVPNEDKSVVKKEKNVKKINLFDSDEEESESSSLFGGDQKKQNEKQKNVLFDDNVTEKQESRDEKKVSSVLFADEVPSKEDKPKSEKKISLFDDDDDLFKDDLFSTSSTKKFTSGLFDDIPEDDLFASNFEDKPQPAGNLVEDLMAIPDNKNSINVDTKAETKETMSYANLDANPGESSQEINSTTDNLFTSSPLTDDIFGRTENGELFFLVQTVRSKLIILKLKQIQKNVNHHNPNRDSRCSILHLPNLTISSGAATKLPNPMTFQATFLNLATIYSKIHRKLICSLRRKKSKLVRLV
jgi:hypothetical protein